MSETIRIDRKDLTSEEIVRELDKGNRIIVEVEILGKSLNMALRRQKGTYYCDTPMKLLRYETRDEMRTCLERYRLARAESADGTEEDAQTAPDE
ncbi:hypothetical protein [Natronococcus wangiae]|uniref:hypothetical protein n=1 Tax=Natronococcus wangiae TaxID=3068275 RepID=UPI00273D778A|nr:hypothetical protein [Natronococcus sp. AD5]